MKAPTPGEVAYAVERLYELEAADKLALDASRCVGGLIIEDVGGSAADFDVILQAFDVLVALRTMLAPHVKRARHQVRQYKRQAGQP